MNNLDNLFELGMEPKKLSLLRYMKAPTAADVKRVAKKKRKRRRSWQPCLHVQLKLSRKSKCVNRRHVIVDESRAF